MAAKTPNTPEEQDNAYNPEALRNAEQKTGYLDDVINKKDPTSTTDNDLKHSPNININPVSAAETHAAWRSTVAGGGKQKGKIGLLKKKGPLAAILALFFGGGFASFMLFSPGIAIVQFKEVLMGDLNDQVRAMDTLDGTLMRAKLGSIQSGVCGERLTIRCKFSTMSEKEVQRFRDAGIEIEPNEPDRNFGRTKPTKLTFPDGTEITNPSELRTYLRNNPSSLSIMRQAFNPKFAGLYSEVSRRVFAGFRTDRSQKVQGDTEEERNQSVDAATSGETAGINADGFRTDEEGRKYVINDQGVRVYETASDSLPAGSIVDSGLFNDIVGENLSLFERLENAAGNAGSGSNAFGSLLSSGMRGINVLGTGDTMCTLYNTARAVSAAAKVTRAIQMAQYFVVFANVADRIMAGVATPEEVEFIGNKLTAVDTREEIVDESSERTSDDPDTAEAIAHENPYYGANAFDSAGYHTAAYNDAPILTSQDMQFLIGGALVGKLSTVLDAIADFFGGRENIRDSCKVVQNPWVRGVGLVVGIISAVGSFGVLTAVSIGGSVVMGFAQPFLEAMLADILAGDSVNGDTEGVDAGNANFAGAGALFGRLAGGHGMTPASEDELEEYMVATEQTNQDRIAAETYEAQKTPFDVYNQYSFLGSFVRAINPAVVKSTASISGALQNVPSLLGVALANIIPSANAQEAFNPKRFQQCNDEGYRDLGIDADVFCNVRYAFTAEQLAMEPDDVAQYMIDNGHINEDGTAKSDEYKDWKTYCAERQDGLGEASNADDANNDYAIGLGCVRKDKNAEQLKRLDNFGVYNMFESLQSTRETGYVTGAGTSGGAQAPAATPEICKTMPAEDLGQIACQAYQFDDYGYLWAGGHGGTAEGFMRDFDAGKYQAGHDQILDCSGLVRMAIFEATGQDIGGLSTGDYPGYSKFVSIPKEQAKAGDILWKTGHTELIVSNDTSAQQYETFGAHTANTSFNKQIGPSSYSYNNVERVFRFQP